MDKTKSKKEQVETFRNNLESTVTIKLECCICSQETIEREYDASELEIKGGLQRIEQEVAEEAYKEGWRYSTSDVYEHVGIHCKFCHKDRNNPKAFEN